MSQIGIKVEDNKPINIDIPCLIETRCLVQANSGAGKSWLLRRLLEQTHGKVQQIVLDVEGEFSSLREKFDYILAGKEGDIPVNIKVAPMMVKLGSDLAEEQYRKSQDRIKAWEKKHGKKAFSMEVKVTESGKLDTKKL